MFPKPLRVAVIGTGAIARLRHLPAVRTAQAEGLAELVVVCDPVESVARAAATDFGAADVYLDYREVVARDDLDLVIVATPNDLHEEISLAALESGKHVLCEKPIALDFAGARRMAAVARRTGLRTAVNFRYRWVPSARYLTDLIRAGELGEIYHVHLNYFNAASHDPDAPIRWRLIRARSGSGVIGDLGSHLIDLAHHWIGPIRRVNAYQRTYTPQRPSPDGTGMVPVDVDEATFCLLEFESGAAGVLATSMCAVGHTNHQRVEIYGTKGSAIYEIGHFDAGADCLRLCFGRSQGRHGGFVSARVPPAHLRSNPEWPIVDFIRAVHSGGEYSPTFEDGLRCQEVIEAVERSARAGTWVSLPLSGDA